MSEKKIVVPEGMLKAVDIAVRRSVDNNQSIDRNELVSVSTEAACRWLSENPIAPTDAQLKDLWKSYRDHSGGIGSNEWVCAEWQRRMFLAPEPEIPNEIEDLIPDESMAHTRSIILEAFRRGQKAGPR